MFSSPTRFLTVALFAGTMLAGAAPASAAHLACQGTTVGLGRGATLDIAMARAVQNWRMHASLNYGNSYSSWYNTLNKGRHCKVTDEITHCRVWAIPCR